MRRKLIIVVVLVLAGILSAAPPAPGCNKADQSLGGISEYTISQRSQALPDSILVIRCEFSDVKIDIDPTYPPGKPDPLPHDSAYFERFMYHLSSYWADASQGNYVLTEDNYTLYPEVVSLSKTMGYYGDNELSEERISEMLVELLDSIDAEIDHNMYDSYIIFHAGAGEEADLSGENEADLWTTYITRKTLQEGLDPENDDFPGLEYDGKYLKQFVIVPETERQPDIQANDPIFGVLGVLCHEFGRLLGLPTLYDNQSSNGKSAGIGNYGIMGTGLWNAAGFVPPLPCAWTRLYMGWAECVTIDDTVVDQLLTYPLNQDSTSPEIYKVKISDDEYFLLENRRQNTDESLFIDVNGDTLATFSFAEVENQQYYPEGHDYAGQPYFDFMENSYAGCEWDFYLPGYGEGDDIANDGSGICIWHVDEQVMREKFNLEEEINVPNGVEEHKAIDLEEADHNQGLDLFGYYGSQNDTYRAGNNEYFGYLNYSGMTWLPTAESYYGGIQLEIYNISEAQAEMSFSVNFEWSLDTEYDGKNSLPAAYLDFGDGVKKLFYPMPDATFYLWENNLLIHDEVILRDTISQCWAWLDSKKQIIIPAQTQTLISLHLLDSDLSSVDQLAFPNYNWVASPLVIRNEVDNSAKIALAMSNYGNALESEVRIYSDDLEEEDIHNFMDLSISAMMYNEHLFVVGKSSEGYEIYRISIDGGEKELAGSFELEREIDNGIIVNISESGNRRMYFTTTDSVLVQINENESGQWELEEEINQPYLCNSYPSYADLDGNGVMELIYGAENSFWAISMEGETFQPSSELALPDSSGLCSGVIPVDVDNDGDHEIAGMMSKNRFCLWQSMSGNDYRLKSGFPLSLGTKGRNFPLVNDNAIYLPCDEGRVFRNTGHNIVSENIPVEYSDLERTGYADLFIENMEEPETSDLFVNDQLYVYPNPYSTIYNSSFVKGVENPGKIGIHVLLTKDRKIDLAVYDIAGNLIIDDNFEVLAHNPETYLLDALKFASGIYVVRLEAGDEVKLLKFGIEK